MEANTTNTKVETQEWATANQCFNRFGLGRGALIKLAESGKIKSVSLKTNENNKQGMLLFNVESIRKLLEAAQ